MPRLDRRRPGRGPPAEDRGSGQHYHQPSALVAGTARLAVSLHFQEITKRFPGVLALDDVSLTVEKGSCHALMGENGAGKSTLGKILAGVYTADAGKILLDGNVIHPATPLAA